MSPIRIRPLLWCGWCWNKSHNPYQLNSSHTTKIITLKLDVSTSIRGLHQKKLVPSSSSSWHDGKMPCWESSRMHGSAVSHAHHDLRPAVPPPDAHAPPPIHLAKHSCSPSTKDFQAPSQPFSKLFHRSVHKMRQLLWHHIQGGAEKNGPPCSLWT